MEFRTPGKKKCGFQLRGKDNFDRAMERIYVWYEQEIIDRAPLRFTALPGGG